MYYVIEAGTDKDGQMMGLNFKKDHRGRSFIVGQRFTDDTKEPVFKQHPVEPLRIEIKEGRENDPFPTFLETPVPLMSKPLFEVIRSAGVNNIDAYEAELYYADGRLASKDYIVFNLIGLVAAADMEKSVYDPHQPDRLISMSFESLTIEDCRTHGFLMFRLAENISTILIHEQVKKAIEMAKIPLIEIYETKDVALL